MKISRADFRVVVERGILSPEQAAQTWKALEEQTSGRARFDLPHVAYYSGALVVLSAMGWFMGTAWEAFGGGGLFVIALAYALAFVLVGRVLWFEKGLRVPGGLLYVLAVGMTPLAVYGLGRLTGFWLQGDPGTYADYYDFVRGSWFVMEVATVAAGLVALWFVRFPFLTAPIAFTLWFMSMDLTPLLMGRASFTWEERLWVSLVFGLAMIVFAYLIDRRTREDYAFWCYLFGLLAFWGGLSVLDSDSELAALGYGLINAGLIGLGVFLQRKTFVVFGGLGVFAYIGHLAEVVFADSILFPFALSGLGLALIYLGVKYQRHGPAFERLLLARMPEGLKRFAPARR